MIGLIIAILAFPVFSAIVLERKFESTIAMSFFLIIGVQYPFYIINRVQIGFFLTCSLVILFYLLSLIAVLKNRSIQARFKNLFTHGFIIFTISSVIVWYLTRNSYVTLWDELNLWASVPKAIFSFGSLQLGPDAAVYPQMQYYPPGMSLLQYFFAKLGQGFHDEKLFFVYALFGLSLMLPAVEYCKIARIIQVPIVTVLIILLPLVYYSVGPDYDVYYKSLFIDGLIGILFAYCLFILFQFELSSTFDIFRLVLGMIALVLLKNSTILFVLSISSLFMWIKLKEKQRHDTTQCSKQHSWYVSDSKVISYERRFQFSDLLLLLPILVYFSWRLTIQHFGVNNNLAAPINFFSISEYILSPTKTQLEIFDAFRSAFFFSNVIQANFLLPIKFSASPAIVLSIMAFSFLLLGIYRINDRKRYIKVMISLLLASMVFIAGLLFLYIFSLGKALPSFSRYINTILLATSTLLLQLILSVDFASSKRQRVLLWLSITLLFLMVLAFSHFPRQRFSQEVVYIDAQNDAGRVSQKIRSSDISRIFLETGKDQRINSLYHDLMYYNLLESRIMVGNFWTDTDLLRVLDWKDDNTDVAPSQKKLSEYLQKNSMEYIFLKNDNPELSIKLKGNFTSEVVSNALYRIDNGGNSVSFKRIFPQLSMLAEFPKEVIGKNEFIQSGDLAPLIDKHGEQQYVLMFEMKVEKPGNVYVHLENGNTKRYDFVVAVEGIKKYRPYCVWFQPTLHDSSVSQALLAFYGGYGSGVIPSVKNVRLFSPEL